MIKLIEKLIKFLKGGDTLKVWPGDRPCKGKEWSEFIKAKMKESGCQAGRRPFTKEQRAEHRIAMKNFWRKRHKMLREAEEKLIEEIE